MASGAGAGAGAAGHVYDSDVLARVEHLTDIMHFEVLQLLGQGCNGAVFMVRVAFDLPVATSGWPGAAARGVAFLLLLACAL